MDESFSCIRQLCNFLKEPLTFNQSKQIQPDVLSREIKQLKYILTLEMTPGFEQWIEGVLRWEQKALAEWNEP